MKRINLIPQELLAPPPSIRGQGVKIISALMALFILMIFWQGGIIVRHKVKIALEKKKIKTLQSSQAEVTEAYDSVTAQREGINNQRKQIVQKLAALQDSRKKRIMWSNVLTKLSGLVPENIKLGKIVLDREIATIGGVSSESSYVSEFMSSLDESEYFQKTGFNYIEKAKDEETATIEFEINTRVALSEFK